MECKNFKNNILNYHYYESDLKTLAEMHEHKANCADCSALYLKISRVLGSADIVKEIQPDSFFYTRLSAKINNQKPEKIYVRMFAKLAQPLFAVCLVILGIFIGFKISSSLQDNNLTNSKTDNSQIVVSQLANEYYLKTADEEIIETYYLNDK